MAIGNTTIVKRSLLGRMFSTVTTVALVGVSVGLMLLLISMRDSAGDAFRRKTGNMQMLISTEPSSMESVLNSVFYRSPPKTPITFEQYGRLMSKRIPFEFAIRTQLGDSYRGRPVMATEEEFFTKFQPVEDTAWAFAEGGAFEGPYASGGAFEAGEDPGPFAIVAGSEAAKETVLAIGDRISISHGGPRDPQSHVHDEYVYEVVGILEPTGTAHDRALFVHLTSSWVLHAHDRRVGELGADVRTTEADLTDDDKKITGIYGRVASRPGSRMGSALPQFLAMLRADPVFTVAEPGAEVEELLGIVSNVDDILLGMAAAVMVSSAIAIMLALYNSMEQRRRQIAVLRVLGASRGRIFLLVLAESAVIGVVGGMLGVLVAFVGGIAVSGVLESSLGLVVEPRLGLKATLTVVGATVALAAVAGVVPAIAGYRTSVVRNLRPFG